MNQKLFLVRDKSGQYEKCTIKAKQQNTATIQIVPNGQLKIVMQHQIVPYNPAWLQLNKVKVKKQTTKTPHFSKKDHSTTTLTESFNITRKRLAEVELEDTNPRKRVKYTTMSSKKRTSDRLAAKRKSQKDDGDSSEPETTSTPTTNTSMVDLESPQTEQRNRNHNNSRQQSQNEQQQQNQNDQQTQNDQQGRRRGGPTNPSPNNAREQPPMSMPDNEYEAILRAVNLTPRDMATLTGDRLINIMTQLSHRQRAGVMQRLNEIQVTTIVTHEMRQGREARQKDQEERKYAADLENKYEQLVNQLNKLQDQTRRNDNTVK